ncbi:hypothetical protein WR25_14134 [Diploscapter pachys]|uniref:Uncharacterized protein n=1 Tax=Diploscapter pachys TaxID=2018661 RepID=A0A2A2KPD5_9BILA|nr:hypothetical protein WR25_14134 [Diploscapter pachys]
MTKRSMKRITKDKDKEIREMLIPPAAYGPLSECAAERRVMQMGPLKSEVRQQGELELELEGKGCEMVRWLENEKEAGKHRDEEAQANNTLVCVSTIL